MPLDWRRGDTQTKRHLVQLLAEARTACTDPAETYLAPLGRRNAALVGGLLWALSARLATFGSAVKMCILQLPFCAAVAYAAHPLLGHGALFFPVVAKGGVERYGGVANSLSGPPSPGQLALPAALGTRRSPCRRPSRDAQTEDLRSPTSTGLGRGVAAPFARRRPNRGHAHLSAAGSSSCFTWSTARPGSAIRQPQPARPAAPFGSRTSPQRHSAAARLRAARGQLI